MRAASLIGCAVLLLLAGAAHADVVVYDNANQNGFDGGCSFLGVPSDFDFANTVPVHTGDHSIRFTPDNYNAVSWCTPAPYSAMSDFAGIRLWVNLSSSAEGASIDLVLGNQGSPVASASLQQLHGAAITANTWVPVQTTFAAAPLSFSGTFDQISLQDESGAVQANVYFDDVSLLSASNQPDPIFANGFESASVAGTIQIDHDFSACIGNLVTERYTWVDALGRTRSAAFSHNNTATNANREGMLCEYT